MDSTDIPLRWSGSGRPFQDLPGIYRVLADLDRPCSIVATTAGVAAASDGKIVAGGQGLPLLATAPALPPARLGSADFLLAHQVRYPYLAGGMAAGIASADLVIALAREGFLASYGAAGLPERTVARALARFAAEIPDSPYAVNLSRDPYQQRLERQTVDLLLQRGVRCVEVSGFDELTPYLVRYRIAGLRRDAAGRVVADNRLIAKVSTKPAAELFLRPAPLALVRTLLSRKLITAEQAECARSVPMADDLTVAGDCGGSTDRHPLAVLLPAVLALSVAIQRDCGYLTPVRVGAAGGLGTPDALAAAFTLGAAYVVTGSVNQACVEAGTSPAVKALLARAEVTDCELAPAADRFELGAGVQVLGKDTAFPERARHLYQLYQAHDGLEALPAAERAWLEREIFRRPLPEAWRHCATYFQQRDPDQLVRAGEHPRRRMALAFRWYLRATLDWAVTGAPDRAADYQIWCGPAIGGFNDWVAGTYLEHPENRRVADVARQLMLGAAFHTRVGYLRQSGVRIPGGIARYRPPPSGTEVNAGTRVNAESEVNARTRVNATASSGCPVVPPYRSSHYRSWAVPVRG